MIYQNHFQKEDIFKLPEYGAHMTTNPLTRMSRTLLYNMGIDYSRLKKLTIAYVDRKFPPGTSKTQSSTVSNLMGAFVDLEENMSMKTFIRLLEVVRIREATFTLQAVGDTGKLHYTQSTLSNKDKALDIPFVFDDEPTPQNDIGDDEFDDDD